MKFLNNPSIFFGLFCCLLMPCEGTVISRMFISMKQPFQWLLSPLDPLPCTSCVCGFPYCSFSVCYFEPRLCLFSLFLFAGRVSFFSSGSENIHRVEKVTWGTRYAITVSFTCDPAHAISDPALHWVTRRRRCCSLARTGPATETRMAFISRNGQNPEFSATFNPLTPRLCCKGQLLIPSFLKWWYLVVNHCIYIFFLVSSLCTSRVGH